ncbi:MAG TPA: hypothetical protein VMM92_00075 [Thermoanaerobaculia bacterium]|nr:hypothetical protein [Thermoanaerobaculia bacterium]
MSRQGYLLLRRAGGLFGVASAEVRGLERRGAIYRIEVDDRHLLADEVVGVIDQLEVRPLAPLAHRFWPEPAYGWAVHAGAPVVVVDPHRPPVALEEGELADGE